MGLRPEAYEHLRDNRIFDGLEELERLDVEQGTTSDGMGLGWGVAESRGIADVVGGGRGAEREGDRGELGGRDWCVDGEAWRCVEQWWRSGDRQQSRGGGVGRRTGV